MCVIVLKMPEGNVTKRMLRNCYEANKQGGGLMYVADNTLFIEKGFFGFRKIYKRFREIEREWPESKIVLHFRIATSGGVNAINCHPFYVHNNIGFAHNGILSGFGNNKISDTYQFVLEVLDKLPRDFLCDKNVVKSLSNYARKSASKFVFLDGDNYSLICNENSGYWENDVWFSNKSYESCTTYTWLANRHTDYDYKQCSVCGLYDDLSVMKYRGEDTYICGYCNWKYKEKLEMFEASEDYKTDSKSIGCCGMCKCNYTIDDGIMLSNGVFYCCDCFNTLLLMFSIECPYCNSSIVLGRSNFCPECNSDLVLEDYADQLGRLEFSC